jgi:shikimate kinase
MNNIILIGFMGCGKTTVGKSIAKIKSMTFVDVDDYIEKKHLKKIKDIFIDEGENTFRQYEYNAIISLSKNSNSIISTGGGAILNKSGIIFYLNSSKEIIKERLINERNNRPLLLEEEWEKKFDSLFDSRYTLYGKEADFIINTDNKSVEEISIEIINLMELK